MAIPKYDEIRLVALALLKERGTPIKLRDFPEPLGKHFKLTEEEMTQVYESGNGLIFYDRISWALSYLSMAELVKRPSRGTYELTDLGRTYLKTPEKINDFVQKTVEQREPSRTVNRGKNAAPESEDKATPPEKLRESFEKIRTSLYDEIIDMILTKTPRDFEKLVVTLLQKMGYGGEIKDAGVVTQNSNDKGIDGIIKEDVLGLGRIYIQAKRYARKNSIDREEIQKFVGALAVAQSNKGVFATTSRYTKGAIEYAASLNGSTTVILIDGNKLAAYMYEYGLGMQIEETIEIKKLDGEFWDTLQDDKKS
jgi:restriction system protein